MKYQLVHAADYSLIYINEVCAKNTTVPDSNGNLYDWIELYNANDEDVDITGFGLSDDETNLFKYTFPVNTVIPSKGYLVVYCDKKASKNNSTIANFGLSTDGDSVFLTKDNYGLIDSISYSSLESDISYGRLTENIETFLFFDIMSPSLPNTLLNAIVQMPSLSQDSGFYSDEFTLLINGDTGCDIYYTLDGSTPDDSSIKYSEGILIYDTSVNENILSNYTNISTNPKYVAPTDKIDKAMIVRAIAINSAGKRSKVITGTYFIGDTLFDKYSDNIIISLVTDESNLFSDDKGIYVTGDTYENWKNGPNYDSNRGYSSMPANYRNKGREWERNCTIQVIKPNEDLFSADGGVRIHGGASRASFQKSFSIYARSEYGVSKFEYDFFDEDLSRNLFSQGNEITTFDSIMLRNTGNDMNQLRFRDRVHQALVSDRSFLNQEMTPAIVFLNGEYWGHYDITEKLSDYYVFSHYGVESDDVCIIKNNELEEGNASSLQEWKELVTWIKNNDFSDTDKWEEVQKKLDTQSYIDYICFELYISNCDWVSNNTAWWKSEKIDDTNEYADGKWRFIAFDTESGSAINSITKYTNDDFLRLFEEDKDLFLIFRSFLKNESFKKDFLCSFLDIANYNFDIDRVHLVIDNLAESYEKYAIDYHKRFYAYQTFTSDDYHLFLEKINDFFNNRYDAIVSYMKSDFDLKGNLVNVTVQNDENLGILSFNTLSSSMWDDGIWTGKYYTDFPIHLHAMPVSGMSFLYYEVTSDNGYTRIYDAEADIELVGDTSIISVYAPDGEKNFAGMPYNGENGTEYDVTVPHIIINQIYGGKKKESYASHSFIELYNQTDEDIDLTGWSLQYRSSIDGGDNAAWSKLDLSGTIPSHCSYLVRCASIKNPVEGSIVIDNYDQDWDQVINNKGCSVVLVANNKLIPADSVVFDNESGKPAIYDYVDMVGVSGNDTDDEDVIANEAALFYEGEASPIQSKKNGIRREKLKDTDNNAEKEDFIAVDYSFGNADYIAYISPKCVADGSWEYNKNNVPKYTVTFVEHDDVTSQKKFKYNTKVDIPDDPEREGYTFAGWFEDEECTTSYKFKNKPVSDITLYAGWTPIDYTITYYNVDGADNSNPISYTIEDDDIILADPVKEGSIFYGWYSDAEFISEAITTIATSDIKNIELYARWKEIITPELAIEGWKYGESANNPEVSGPVSGAAISFEYKTKGSDDSTYSENVPILVGDYTVKATLSETEEYVFDEVTTDFAIARAQLTVKAVDSSKLYSNLDPVFTADVIGLQYDDSAADVVYTLYRASGENVGTYSLMPSGNAVQGNYDVVYTGGTFTINAKTVTDPAVVLSSDSFVYDGTAKTPGVTVMDGSTVIDPNEYNVNISNNTAEGIATVTITDKDGGNYIVSGSKEFTISKAVPAILIAPEAGALVYGQSLADSVVTGGAVSVAGTFAWDNAEIIPSVANSGVTEYSVVFTPADTDNYDTVKFGVKVTVTKAEPQYTVPTGITAVYGDILADVKLPDGWTWADGSVSVGDVGVHSFAAIYTPVDTINYNNVEAQIEVSVGKDAPVLTVPVAKANLTYTGTAQELVSVNAVSGGAISFVVTYSDGADLAGVLGDDAFSNAIPTGTSAGTYTVWYKVTGDVNHLDTEPASLSVVIGRASAVVCADNSSKAYGEADLVLSATVSGLKGSDTQDVLSYSLFRSAGESVGTYNIIAIGDAVQGNYNVSYVQGAFTITTKTVTDPVIVLSQDSFVYDGTAKTPSVTVRVANTIIDPSEYTVTYSNNIEAGTATVTITDKVGGNFEISGSVTFTIAEPETENQGEGENQSGDGQGEGQGQDDTQSGTEQGEGQGQDDTQSGTELGEGEGQGQDDTQSGTEQGEGQGQDETQSDTERGEGQGQDESQSGTEQGNDQNQGQSQTNTEQGQTNGESGSQQSSSGSGNSGYTPVIVPGDNTSNVTHGSTNTGFQDSSSGNGNDGKDTETGKDVDKDSSIPSLSASVKNIIEIATSELFESLTKTLTGEVNESDVVAELKVSKTKITVKKGKTSEIKPKLVTKSADGTVQTISDVSRFRFISLNPSVAEVSKKGTVTGTSSGSCTIYVIAENGMFKQIKVTVK